MIYMKKLMIFPYHPDIEVIITYAEYICNFTISGIASYKEDNHLVKELNQKIGCGNDFDEAISNCDCVLLLDNYRQYQAGKYYEVIKQAKFHGKEIMAVPSVLQELGLNEKEHSITPFIKEPEFHNPKLEIIKYAEEKKLLIETPVIAVLGMGKNCSKFENQLNLYLSLTERNYKVTWIASNPIGVLWGGYTMPDFMFDEKLAFKAKVLQFNHFIYKMGIEEKPDVFIIGIPEGITEFQTGEYNHFGEYPLIVGSAVPIDSAILCTYFVREPKAQGIKKLANHVTEKFSAPVDAISIGKTIFDTEEGSGKIFYSFLENFYLKKYYSAENQERLPLLTLWNKEEYQAGLNALIEKLQDNADAI